MTQITFTASCPICGRTLFKGTPNSYLECGCPKCKEYIKVKFTENGFTALVSAKKEKETE